jgi:hypothetical protein
MLTDQDNEHLHRGDVLPRGQRVPTGVLPARACFGARRGWSERWGRASSRSTPHHPKRCEWIGGRLTAGRKRTSRLTPKHLEKYVETRRRAYRWTGKATGAPSTAS